MALDYSKLSDQELEAIANDDYASLSDATLNALASEGQPPEKSLGEKAATAAGGVAGMAVDAATGAYNAIPYKELVVPYAGYKMIPKAVEGVKTAGRAMGTLMSPSTPISPSVPNPATSPSYAAASKVAPVAPTGAQSIVQKLALDKVLKNAGPIAAGMQIAQGLFHTSPEEIQILKQAEARKRAQGWKPLNER